jgi:hypothetical protein
MKVNEKKGKKKKGKQLYECRKRFKLFSWPCEIMCNGTGVNEGGQPSCMVCWELLTRVHHHLSYNVHILDAAPPMATGAESGSL